MSSVVALLKRTSLPCAISSSMFSSCIVAVRGTKLVGTVGLEQYGSAALLRSFAVDPSCRGQGVGRELFRRILERASTTGVTSVYILTTTIEDLCVRWGFSHVERAAVPSEIAASEEFRGACPATAVCMMRVL